MRVFPGRKGTRNGLHQHIVPDRLVQHFTRAKIFEPRPQHSVARTGYGNGDGSRFSPLEYLKKIKAVHFRHVDVHNQAGVLEVAGLGQELGGGRIVLDP